MEVKKINDNKTEITIKVEGKEWEKALDKSFEKNVKDRKIDGFRKGKIPKDMFIKTFGLESLFQDAIDEVIPNAYEEVLKETKLNPATQPNLTLKAVDEKGVELVFEIITSPELKLGKYKKLDVKKSEIKVSKKEIDEEIELTLKKYAELAIKEGKVEAGNIATINFEGFLDDKPFEGGKSENYPLEIGSNSFIPGFEDQVIGMEKDEEKDIKVTFPENYHSEELKGKEVVFKVKVNEIKEKTIPELNEEFFKDYDVEGISNEKELREDIKERITVRKEQAEENVYIDALLEAAAKESKVEIPEEIISDEVHRMMDQFGQQLSMQGINMEQYMQMTGVTHEKMHEDMNPEAKKRVHYRLLLDAIAEKEKIEATDKEAEKQAEELATNYQMEKEQFLSMFGGLDMIKYDIKVKKTMEFLKENN
jgi:trigger factor